MPSLDEAPVMDVHRGMDLETQTRALLEPGDVALNGAIVHTDLGREDEREMNRLTIEVGKLIADRAGLSGETYVEGGTDDPRFALNQFQGLTLAGDAFVWECQQLVRDGTFDLVFYYGADLDHDAIVDAIRTAGHDVTGVEVG